MTKPDTSTMPLKPCPFCGEKAEFRDDGEKETPYWVSCYDCTISTAEFDDPEWPVFEWNTRASEAKHNEILAEVEKRLIEAVREETANDSSEVYKNAFLAKIEAIINKLFYLWGIASILAIFILIGSEQARACDMSDIDTDQLLIEVIYD